MSIFRVFVIVVCFFFSALNAGGIKKLVKPAGMALGAAGAVGSGLAAGRLHTLNKQLHRTRNEAERAKLKDKITFWRRFLKPAAVVGASGLMLTAAGTYLNHKEKNKPKEQEKQLEINEGGTQDAGTLPSPPLAEPLVVPVVSPKEHTKWQKLKDRLLEERPIISVRLRNAGFSEKELRAVPLIIDIEHDKLKTFISPYDHKEIPSIYFDVAELLRSLDGDNLVSSRLQKLRSNGKRAAIFKFCSASDSSCVIVKKDADILLRVNAALKINNCASHVYNAREKRYGKSPLRSVLHEKFKIRAPYKFLAPLKGTITPQAAESDPLLLPSRIDGDHYAIIEEFCDGIPMKFDGKFTVSELEQVFLVKLLAQLTDVHLENLYRKDDQIIIYDLGPGFIDSKWVDGEVQARSQSMFNLNSPLTLVHVNRFKQAVERLEKEYTGELRIEHRSRLKQRVRQIKDFLLSRYVSPTFNKFTTKIKEVFIFDADPLTEAESDEISCTLHCVEASIFKALRRLGYISVAGLENAKKCLNLDSSWEVIEAFFNDEEVYKWYTLPTSFNENEYVDNKVRSIFTAEEGKRLEQYFIDAFEATAVTVQPNDFRAVRALAQCAFATLCRKGYALMPQVFVDLMIRFNFVDRLLTLFSSTTYNGLSQLDSLIDALSADDLCSIFTSENIKRMLGFFVTNDKHTIQTTLTKLITSAGAGVVSEENKRFLTDYIETKAAVVSARDKAVLAHWQSSAERDAIIKRDAENVLSLLSP